MAAPVGWIRDVNTSMRGYRCLVIMTGNPYTWLHALLPACNLRSEEKDIYDGYFYYLHLTCYGVGWGQLLTSGMDGDGMISVGMRIITTGTVGDGDKSCPRAALYHEWRHARPLHRAARLDARLDARRSSTCPTRPHAGLTEPDPA